MTTNDEREPPKWQADATELDAAGPGPTMAPNVIILPYVSVEKGENRSDPDVQTPLQVLPRQDSLLPCMEVQATQRRDPSQLASRRTAR